MRWAARTPGDKPAHSGRFPAPLAARVAPTMACGLHRHWSGPLGWTYDSVQVHERCRRPCSAVPAPVDVDRIMACVRELGLRFFLDDEGDIGIPWRYVTVHAIFQDTRALQLRGVWHRIADTEHLTALRRLVEEWNATRIGPKAYLTIADGGVVRLHGEVTYPLEAGMTDAQLEDFVLTGCRLIVALMREAEDLFPDPLRGRLDP